MLKHELEVVMRARICEQAFLHAQKEAPRSVEDRPPALPRSYRQQQRCVKDFSGCHVDTMERSFADEKSLPGA